MQFVLKPVVAAALMLGASGLSSHAAQIPVGGDLGTFTGAPATNSRTIGDDNVSGHFDDLFSFRLAQASQISVSIINSYSASNQIINDFMLSWYNGATGSGPSFMSVPASNVPDPTTPGAGTQSGRLTRILDLGDYSFRVSGTTNGDSPSYGGSLSISVSPVPLPASAPMLGVALLALGAVGYGAKRRQGSAPA